MSIEFETDPETGRPIVDLDRLQMEFHLTTPLRVALDPLGPRLSVTARFGTNVGPQQVTLHLDGPSTIEALRQFRDILADVDVPRLEAAIRLIRQ